jgi:hypothetical protein
MAMFEAAHSWLERDEAVDLKRGTLHQSLAAGRY